MKNNSFQIGDNVIADPKGFNEFSGIVIGIRQEKGKMIYTIRDQEDDCFDCEENEIELS